MVEVVIATAAVWVTFVVVMVLVAAGSSGCGDCLKVEEGYGTY